MTLEAKTTRPQPVAAASTLRVQAPRVYDGGWAEAHELALTQLEPVFVPVVPFTDDRGWSYMNMLHGAMGQHGQINFSMQYPGVVKAWHRHNKQTDFWMCLVGHIKAGIHRESDGASWMLVTGEKRPGVLIIPPPLWHGVACVGPQPAGLLYYVTHGYDPAHPDEFRRPWDSVDGFPWETKNG